MIRNTKQAMAYIRKHGIVLVSAEGPVPKLVDALAGEPVKGSWWGHPQGGRIFAALDAITDSPEILVCRLVGGKVTVVHERLWPALVLAAPRFPAARLAKVIQEHTASGKHVNRVIAFPKWVPAGVVRKAKRLGEAAALEALGPWTGKGPEAGRLPGPANGRASRPRR